MFLRKPKKAFPFRGKGDHEVVDEGNLYHRLYGIRYQFYVLQICSVSQVVEGADPYTAAVYIYGFGIREPSPFGEGGGEADG